jgi:hypothetical protein
VTTKAKASRGTLLQRGDGATSEVFTTIAEVKSVKGPGPKVGTLDATSQDSVAKEFVADIPDYGDVSLSMIWVGSDAQQQGLQTDMDNGTARNFKLIKNDHASTKSTINFTAIVTSLEHDAPESGVYPLMCTLKVTGKPTISYAPYP